MNISYKKPLTIKEYTKNYKIIKKQKESQKEKEIENLNKSQNIFLYKILQSKKKNAKISIDSSINRTIENTFNNEENKKKVLKFLKNKKREIPKTALVSPSKMQNSGKSPSFFSGNANPKKIIKE